MDWMSIGAIIIYLCVVGLLTIGTGDVCNLILNSRPKGFNAIVLWTAAIAMIVMTAILLGVGGIGATVLIEEVFSLYAS